MAVFYLGIFAMASGTSHERGIQLTLRDIQLTINWEDVTCPICLDFPHNAVLLQCSSRDKGCHPFICDTDYRHSNCVGRFKSAYEFTTKKVPSTPNHPPGEIIQAIPSQTDSCPSCPLCRGHVTGWVVVDAARLYLNSKKRCCEEKHCTYVGNFVELQMHALQEHPHSRPSEIDPAQKLSWENFQQSSEIIDVLTTIHSEVPHGVVLGDYVIEYGNESGDDYEDFPGDEGNWWTSCILYQVFDNFRASRSRRRSRANETRRGQDRSGYDGHMDEVSSTSVNVAEYQFEESDDEFMGTSAGEPSRGSSGNRSYRRRRWHFHDP